MDYHVNRYAGLGTSVLNNVGGCNTKYVSNSSTRPN